MLDATAALAAAARSQTLSSGFFRGLALLLLGLAGTGLFALNHLGVKTREHEFGLRRALGATRMNILLLVMIETLALGMGAALFGTLLGFAACAALTSATGWAMRVDGWIIAQVALAAVTMSLLASLLPALQAALRNPAQALNRE